MTADDDWTQLTATFSDEPDLEPGQMMRHPALCHRGKVVVFLAEMHGPGLGARIGATDPESLGITDFWPLSPFKTKPPLKGWIIVPPGDPEVWRRLTEAALASARGA